MTSAAGSTQFGTDDGDDLDAPFAQQHIGVGIAIAGENYTGRCADQIRVSSFVSSNPLGWSLGQ